MHYPRKEGGGLLTQPETQYLSQTGSSAMDFEASSFRLCELTRVSRSLNYQSYLRSGTVRRLEILASESESMKINTVSSPLLRRNTDVGSSVGVGAGMRFTSVSVPPGQRFASRCRTHLLSGMMGAAVPSGVRERPGQSPTDPATSPMRP